MASLETFLTVTSGCEGLLLASNGYRPGMLLNVLQCAGQASPPPHQKFIWPQMLTALRVRNPGVEGKCYSESNDRNEVLASNNKMDGRAIEIPLKVSFVPLLTAEAQPGPSRKGE